MNQIAGLGNQVCSFWNNTVTDGIKYSQQNPELGLASYLGTSVAIAASTYFATRSVKWAGVAAMVTAALPHGLEGLASWACPSETKSSDTLQQLNDVLFKLFPKVAQDKAEICANELSTFAVEGYARTEKAVSEGISVASEAISTVSKWVEKRINEFKKNHN